MPIGALGFIWLVLKRLIECTPMSVLDVGCATGRFGVIARDYLECLNHKNPPMLKSGWKVRIEGLEVHEPYLSMISHYIYDKVYVADARKFFADASPDQEWDVIVMMDVIEHMPEADAKLLIQRLSRHANKYVIIGAPYGHHPQESMWDNDHDAHHFDVTEKFFEDFDIEQLWHVDRSVVAVIKCHDGDYDKPDAETFKLTDLMGSIKTKRLETDQGFREIN